MLRIITRGIAAWCATTKIAKEKALGMSETQSPQNESPQEMLLGMAMGYMLARAVHVAAETGSPTC